MVPRYQIINTYMWYHGTIGMQNEPKIDKKLADWVSAFNSIPDKQSQDATILKDLILGYHAKPKKMEIDVIASR